MGNTIQITPQQCKRARALLKWNPQDLASHTRVSVRIIEQFERNQIKLQKPDNNELVEAFHKQKIEFARDGNVHFSTASGGHSGSSELSRIDASEKPAAPTGPLITASEARATANVKQPTEKHVHIGTSPQTGDDY